MSKGNAGKVSVDLELNSKNYDKQLNSKLKGSENAFSSSFKKIGTFIAGAFAVKKVTDFTKSCIDSASKVQSAFTGLNSIVQGTGNSFSEAQKFVKEYTKDGLVSIEETATAYKNLLARGYDTSQIEDVMTRLKDSAAFGRQASYDLGEAVVSATEGLKNENSILVDNAGVTKNVAKMWEEWAKAHNTTASAMTQAQKIEAEYNGIMQETRFQIGDATAYTKTFGGQLQQLKFNFNQMTVAIGKVVAPIAQLFIPIINSAINAVTKFFEKTQDVLKKFGLEMPDVVSKSSSSIEGIGSSSESAADSAIKASKKIKKAFGSVDEINVLSGGDESSDTGSTSSGSTSSPIIDESNVSSQVEKSISIFDKLKEALQNVWNSAPVQAYVDYSVSQTKFAFDLIKTLGTDLYNNMSITWGNISTNVSTAIGNISTLFTNMFTDMASGIETWGQPIIDGVSGLFNSIWIDAIDPVIQIISQVWADFSQTLLELWNEYGEPLINNVGEFVTKLIDLFQSIWDNIINPILTPFLDMVKDLWENHLKDLVYKIGDFIGKLTNFILDIINVIMPIINFLLDVLQPIISTVGKFISDVFGTVFGVISDVIGGILDALGGVIDFITGVFSGDWGKAWDGICSIFSGIWNAIWGIIKGIINLVISAVEGLINIIIDGLNLIIKPLAALGNAILDLIGVKDFSFSAIPKVSLPRLAEGSWFKTNDPQLAIVGDNKTEPEIVTPESKIYDQVNKAIKDNGGIGKQEIEITIYHKYEDGRTIIQKINQEQINAGEILLLT